jgi:hypothetical protein
MIRFQRIFELATEQEWRTFAEARELFREAFPSEPSAIDRIERMIVDRARLDFLPMMLVALNSTGRVTGLTFTYYFPEIQFGSLQRVGRLGYPTLVVQEGGYSIQNLRTGAKAFFSGLCGEWY